MSFPPLSTESEVLRIRDRSMLESERIDMLVGCDMVPYVGFVDLVFGLLRMKIVGEQWWRIWMLFSLVDARILSCSYFYV